MNEIIFYVVVGGLVLIVGVMAIFMIKLSKKIKQPVSDELPELPKLESDDLKTQMENTLKIKVDERNQLKADGLVLQHKYDKIKKEVMKIQEVLKSF